MTPVYKGLEADFDAWLCPYCDSQDIDKRSEMTTLVGFGGGSEDPNHWTANCHCRQCDMDFFRHWVIRGRKIWYTTSYKSLGPGDFMKVLRGVAGCCVSSYAVSCGACGGWMRHSGTLYGNGVSVSKMLPDGKWVPQQPMFFECLSCHHRTEDPRFPGYMEIP